MADQVNIQVIFTYPATDSLPEYRDALYFTPEEYDGLTQAEIDAQKQARYDAWVAMVTAPQPEPDPAPVPSDTAAVSAIVQQAMDNLVQAQQALTGDPAGP